MSGEWLKRMTSILPLIARRILVSVVILFIVSALLFCILRLLAGRSGRDVAAAERDARRDRGEAPRRWGSTSRCSANT